MDSEPSEEAATTRSPQDGLDFLSHRGNLSGPEAVVPHLSPTTLTADEQQHAADSLQCLSKCAPGKFDVTSVITAAEAIGLALAVGLG
jgi:hypothetical protein